ncbi:hypothetical protein LOKG_00031 [Loktanella phage pCB2051-A]|uniref:Major tail protein n=1 Tax=Loktanella phage pCB2051-A TaxID=754044 RepID=M4R169_9CAUD|nr:major tail protein with Ig-like domain [Loktanella phage pCB2051-A]AGH31467.1 hypothetical protein LOKG_00031 [Loktanella phage pCB2051-A]
MAQSPNNYVLGRGEVWFDQYAPGTLNTTGELYLGNTPEWNVSAEADMLDHYGSDRGIREKDASETLQVNRTGSVITDNISAENVAYFFFGTTDPFTVAGGAIAAESYGPVTLGRSYQLGVTPTNPVGVQQVSLVSVTDVGGTTTYVEGTDYEVDLDLGRIQILVGGDIDDTDMLEISYTVTGYTIDRIISGGVPIEGQLRYIEYNPAGKSRIWVMPRVKLSPNGDYNLKGDDWQQIPLNVEVLKKGSLEAIYIDGKAV